MLVIALASPSPAFTGDDFNDGTIDPLIWSAYFVGTGASVEETGGEARIELQASSAGPTIAGGYESRCNLSGDFDLRVDYVLHTWPALNGVRVSLSARTVTASYLVERVSFGAFEGAVDAYVTDLDGPVSTPVPASGTSGSMRLVRVGTNYAGYYWNGTAWTLVGSGPGVGDEVSFALQAHSHDSVFGDQLVSIAFDDLSIASGTSDCSALCGNGVLDPGESCDDGLGSGDPLARDYGDDSDSCPNGPGAAAIGVACVLEQRCGDVFPLTADSTSRCAGTCPSSLEQCDNGDGTAIINGQSTPFLKNCFGDSFVVCTADSDCGALGPCGNTDAVAPACNTSCSLPGEICDDAIDNDGDGLVDGDDSDCFHLSFPLPNRSPCSARVNAAFDHSMPSGAYRSDGVVTAYTGEEGSSVASSWSVNFGWGALHGYSSAGTPPFPPFEVNGHYTGGGEPDFLFYDGHPGYDYRTTDQDPDPPAGRVPVRSAASGVVACISLRTADGADMTREEARSASTNDACTEGAHFGEVKVDHGNGYYTVYMHLAAVLADLHAGDPVVRGEEIGTAGETGAAGAPHLHFEVRKDLGGTLVPVDPYGWLPGTPDPYPTPSTDLWTAPDAPSVAASCPGEVSVPAGPTESSALGGASVPGGVDVFLDEPTSGSLAVSSTLIPVSQAAQQMQDPASVNFELPTDNIHIWEIAFDHLLTNLASANFGYFADVFTPDPAPPRAVYHYIDCNEHEDCGWTQLRVLGDDGSTIGVIEITSFSQFVLGGQIVPPSTWVFYGTAEGGKIEFAVGAVALEVSTVAGQTSTEVATSVAQAIGADPVLSASGIAADATENVVSTTGSITWTSIGDSGLTAALNAPESTQLPLLGPVSLAMLAATMGFAARYTSRKKRGQNLG